MAMFNKCANCKTSTIGGKRDGDLYFCTTECQDWFRAPGFCKACMESTTDTALGGTYTMNGIGSHLYALACKGKKCATCSSVPKRKWFVVIFIPIFPISREFRVKYMTQSRYFGRQVKSSDAGAVAMSPAAAVVATQAAGFGKCPKCGTGFAADTKSCPICAGRAATAGS